MDLKHPKTISPLDARIVIYTIAIETMKANTFDEQNFSEQVRSELNKANEALVKQLEENRRYYKHAAR